MVDNGSSASIRPTHPTATHKPGIEAHTDRATTATTMPPQAAAAVAQQGDCCRHGQPPRWHAGGAGEPLPFYLPQRKRLSVDGNAKPPGPWICIWECDGEAGDITCDIVAAPFRRSCSARPTQAPAAPFFRMMTPPPPRPQRVVEAEEEASKPGKAIRRGHRSYGLMLNLQLGIRQENQCATFSYYQSLKRAALSHCWLGFMMMQLFRGEVVGAAVQEALGVRLRPAGEGVDAVPAGRVQAHTAASLRRFPVEGLLPCRIQASEEIVRGGPCGLHACHLRQPHAPGAGVPGEERELLLRDAGRSVHD